MKTLFKKIIFTILSWCARARIARLRLHGAQIIGITGSMGKTTCKDAIAHVLSGPLRVLKSDKSYNTELGLPLTILELKSEFSSVIGWAKNLLMAMWRGFFDRTTYDVVVLEMGVDKPGDMDVLLGILSTGTGAAAPLHCAVFMGVHPVHLADGQFPSLDAIFDEKAKLVKAVPSGGTVFLNADDERCARLGPSMSMNKNGPKVVMFGANEKAKLRALDMKSQWGSIAFGAEYGEVRASMTVPILGTQHIASLLPAIGCGLILGMYMPDIADRLSTFKLPPGRLSLIEGIQDSWIIDSSYNASPDAVRAALDTLKELAEMRGAGEQDRAMRRVFVFGNMNELGDVSEKEHRDIAAHLPGRADVLVAVGDMAAHCAEETLANHTLTQEQVYTFLTTEEATAFMLSFVQPNDLILVKGSQNKVRLERLVKAIMKHPDQAPLLLARQDWKS